ncbi:hypothetical protein MASR2M66_25990 [Chloroflexota bacterium]
MRGVGLPNLSVSVITIGELYYGARDNRELTKIKKHLASLNQIAVDEEISEITLSLLESYALSHRLSLPDAIIAATALRHSIELYTLNLKDFRYIEGLLIYKP